MRNLLLIGLALLLAVPAFAVQYVCYSWEDGGTVIATYGANLVGDRECLRRAERCLWRWLHRARHVHGVHIPGAYDGSALPARG